MDVRLTVNDAVRELSVGLPEEVALLSTAWRAMNEHCRQRGEELEQSEAETEQNRESLASIAQRAFRFRRIVRTAQTTENQSDHESVYQELQTIVQEIVDALDSAGVSIISPVDEPYTAELMELVENVAQRTEAAIVEPRIVEILEPAILHTRSGSVILSSNLPLPYSGFS